MLDNVSMSGNWRNRVTSQYVAWNKSSTLVACSGDGAISMAVVDVAQQSVVRTIATGGQLPPTEPPWIPPACQIDPRPRQGADSPTAPTYALQFSPTQENLLAVGWRSTMVLFVDVQTGLHQFVNVATLARSTRIWSATPLITGICFSSDGLVVYIGMVVRARRQGLVRTRG